MSLVRSLPTITLRQYYRYLARYVRYNPSLTRSIPPQSKLRIPTTPGLGVFFYPPDKWTKTTVQAVGSLGETSDTIHPSRFQITRPVGTADESDAGPLLNYWGVGGAMSVTKNLMSGVSEGFAVTLELHGVGYRADEDKERNKLVLRVGYSHTVEFELDDGDVFFNVISPQVLQVAGINRGKVHQMAAKVRAVRKPEPYKGKGIRYRNEKVRRLEAKKD